MTRFQRVLLLLAALALPLASGCASRPARVTPAGVAPPPVAAVTPPPGTTPAAPPPPAAAPAETAQAPAPAAGPPTPLEQIPAEVAPGSPLLQPVTENQTFVTVEGVPRYKIGPGDVLEILFATGTGQERQTAVVQASGIATVAFVEVAVADLTAGQAADRIREALSRIYRRVSAEVVVREYHSKRVTVMGVVAGRVGAFPLKGKTTLIDALAEAGGPAPDADLERVRVLRPGAPPVTVNFFRVLEAPAAQNLVLDAGDVVFVPPRALATAPGAPGGPAAPGAPAGAYVPEEARKVFVLGEVRHPGAFPLTPHLRLSQAVALAGGPTDVAVLENARVIRGNVDAPEFVEADFRRVLEEGDPTHDVVLRPGDLIVLPRSAIGNWNAFIAKIKPTLEVLTFPLALPVQIRALTR